MGDAKSAGGLFAGWTLKYFDKITAAQAISKSSNTSNEDDFDFNDLGAGSRWSPFLRPLWLWTLRAAFAFFRTFWPFPKFGRLVIVTRDADVRDVLTQHDVFRVPYGPEMLELGGGVATFVLGLEGEEQRRQHEIIKGLWRAEDTDWLIGRTRQIADTLIDASEGRIDVMKDLITRVASETCAEFFGLHVDDPDAFAEWSMSISALLFADPFGNPATRKLGLAGAARVRSVIDAALRNSPAPRNGLDKSILERLRATNISHGEILAIMVGMITGFIPTTTLAAGNILEELLRKRSGLDAAIAAAKQARSNGGDASARQQLEQILFEAARLNPALNPGQWRYAAQDGAVKTALGSHHIAKDSILLVSTASAMWDRHSTAGYELVFGTGVHNCLGKTLAMAQITEIFEALLSRDSLDVRRNEWGCIHQWGRIQRVGVFPRRLDMEFKPAYGSQVQSMATVLAPLNKEADLDAWRHAVEQLNTDPNIRGALRDTNLIHFASLNAIDLGDEAAPAPHLLLELNGDGTSDSLIDAAGTSTRQWLESLFRSAARGDKTPDPSATGAPLAELLRKSSIELTARPWGTTGLCFYGLPGQSIASIERQDALVKFCRQAVDYFVKLHAGTGNHAMVALQFVRRLIHGDKELSKTGDACAEMKALVDQGPSFRPDLMIPSRQQPLTIDWTKPDSRIRAVLSSPTLVPVYGLLVLIVFGISALCFWWFGFSLSSSPFWVAVGKCAIAFVSGCIGTAALIGAIVLAFVWRLGKADATDRPEDLDPNLSVLRKVAERENDPGCEQNHFLSVSPLKPGWFRKLTLGISLWGIELVVSRAFRPGYIVNMGTIHFARWFRPPGSERLVFLSNYDGSWESYLEDFITKAYQGQNAAWSNALGFPRTKGLTEEGAQDGDRFKRWVRRQQKPTQFWFNRLSHLTADQMRNNAVIAWELARATTDSQARAWLSYFGSTPKTDTVIETQEVQAVTFRGFARLPYMKFAAIRLPDDLNICTDWLASLIPDAKIPDGELDVKQPEGLKVTFGDRPFTGQEEDWAVSVAFTAAGLAHLQLPGCGKDEPGTVATFPPVFNLGMSSRQRILGDHDKSEPAGWRWADSRHDKAVHVAVFVYGRSREDCDRLFEPHRSKLGAPLYEIDTEPAEQDKKGDSYEHFGFRDGISQPVIRGTQRFARGAQPRDIMAPGEFILGYKSNQGYYPPTPMVSRENDPRDRLGSIPAPSDSRFSAFQDPRPQLRDFGRNGSFLAIRQLEQHVDEFHAYAGRCLGALPADISNLIGGPATQEWVEAKMMGRWHDGTPLIDVPMKPAAPAHGNGTDAGDAHQAHSPRKHSHRQDRMSRDTNLDFGVDDPQGLFCPFGAHIRRANPRGSLAPGDDSQLMITNRHRLLRRGRSYGEKGKGETGLLFIGLCADLERQFEFIQQSWLGSNSFAGLTNEPDPIVGARTPGASTRFTIPTSVGSLVLPGASENFVTVRGGGYFFMPSRSALVFLREFVEQKISENKPASAGSEVQTS